MPLLPSGKSSRAQLQVASIPGEAPKPRRRSSRAVPAGDNRPPGCAIWRRLGSAGPIVFFANAATLAAPSTRAPTALAHNTRAPSVDHSHAGSWLVAWTESLGSARPCNWNSLVLMMMIGQAAQFVVFFWPHAQPSRRGSIIAPKGRSTVRLRGGDKHNRIGPRFG
jgi:hypothetical protein